jgi:hypothetical protein
VSAKDERVLVAVLASMHAWLHQGSAFVWTADEFQVLANTLTRFKDFGLLLCYAAAARKRQPDNPEWRLHEIIARTSGDALAMTVSEQDEIERMLESAAEREDFHTRARIARFLGIDSSALRRHKAELEEMLDELGPVDRQELFESVLESMPQDAAAEMRRAVKERGRAAAITETFNDLSGSPLGAVLPEPMLRRLSEALVDKAFGSPAGGKKGRF